jgi:hypothetical protein
MNALTIFRPVFLNLCFVTQIDHAKKNYKFGFGMTVGE